MKIGNRIKTVQVPDTEDKLNMLEMLKFETSKTLSLYIFVKTKKHTNIHVLQNAESAHMETKNLFGNICFI